MRIKQAEYLKEYKISFTFEDGTVKTIDFHSFLQKANNPMSYQFLDIEKFKKFKIWHGHLAWPGHQMAFSAISLRYWDNKTGPVPCCED